MSKCDHVIAFKYGEAYGTDSGYAISLTDLKNNLKYYQAKLNSDDTYTCSFCPNCGMQLDQIIDKTIKETKKSIIKRKKEEQVKRKKQEKEFKLKKATQG